MKGWSTFVVREEPDYKQSAIVFREELNYIYWLEQEEAEEKG